MTPDPRLGACSKRDPNHSSGSPKNWRKTGSLANGEFEVRTTASAEMLTMPPTARPAMALKSGRPEVPMPPGCTTGTAAVALGDRGACAASPSLAERNRPVRTCLLYTSDAADDLLCVDLGGRR